MPFTPARATADPMHSFDSKRAQGTRCSCGHERSDHVERYEPGQPLLNVCRGCVGPRA